MAEGMCDMGVGMAGGPYGGQRDMHGRGASMHETHPLKSVACILLECILVLPTKFGAR